MLLLPHLNKVGDFGGERVHFSVVALKPDELSVDTRGFDVRALRVFVVCLSELTYW